MISLQRRKPRFAKRISGLRKLSFASFKYGGAYHTSIILVAGLVTSLATASYCLVLVLLKVLVVY